MNDRLHWTSIIKSLSLYLIFFLIMVFIISQKQNMHVDEVWSYVLANNPGEQSLKYLLPNGETIPSAGDFFTRYMEVDPDHRFDYRTVWDNQTGDVHPPFYYAILHTICSLFPGRWSKWMAALINIFAALGVLYFFRRLLSHFCDDPVIRTFLSISWILLAGFLHTVTFFRMYVLPMLFVTAATASLAERSGREAPADPVIPGNGRIAIRRVTAWLPLWLCIFLGALTHYYCTLYMILLCTIWGIYYLCNRHFREMTALIITSVTAGFSAVFVFPGMIDHVLHSNHGVSAQAQLQERAGWFDRLAAFFRFLNDEVFGGLLGILALSLLFLMILHRITDKKTLQESHDAAFHGVAILLTGIVCGLYFLAVAVMASMKQDRYLFPIYAVLYATLLCAAYAFLKRELSSAGARSALIVLLAVLLSGSAARTSFPFLYRESAPAQAYADQNPDTDCILIYGENPWMINSDIYEIMRYASLTTFQKKAVDPERIKDVIGDHSETVIILIRVGDEDALLKQILEFLPQRYDADLLQTFTYGSSYRIRSAPADD
ncbi:MAG: hypothetical protein II800_02745 [Lachnospiraceae bacterium]|nr:hypothetical protein [Lachnospiraceae bacterium]